MDCAQFESLLHDLDRPGTEAFRAREAALSHAESCSRCAQLLTQSEWLDLALRGLAEREAGQRAPGRIERALRDEFARHQAGPRRVFGLPVVALATAAVLLLVLGLALHHRNAQRAANGSPSDAHAGNAAGAGIPRGADFVQPDSAGWEELVAENRIAESDSATAFVPLPYADGSTSSDNGAIVQVVLSRPALASLGLPVVDIGATDRIPAEIIVSEDGAPQAIRLVAQETNPDE